MDQGPLFYVVSDVSDVTLLAGGSTSGRFRFPRTEMLHGILLFPRDGLEASSAALALRAQTDRGEEIFFESLTSVARRNEIRALEMSGLGFVWMPLARSVRVGEEWTFTIRNTSLGPLVPVLYLQRRVSE